MLRRAPILVFFMALAMLISCTPQNAGPDVVRVHFSDGTPKMIGYDGSTALNGSVSIDSYRVGVQPSGGSVTYSEWFDGETNTYDITGLVIGGSYTISVDGAIAMKEGDPVVISKASSPYTVQSGTNDVYLELSDFVDGEAESLTVTLTPPTSADDASAVTYKGSLQTMAGVEQATAVASGTTLTFTSADHDLTAGLYLLTVTATEGEREWKATDVVRLLPGLPATGTMAFKGEDGVDVDVSFDDQMGRVIMFAGEDGVSMDGTEVTVTAGSAVVVDFTGTDAGTDDVTMRIYVNGIQLTEGSGYTKSGAVYTLDSTVKGFVEGRNVVTFMASNGKPFGVGSMDYIVNLEEVKQINIVPGGAIDLRGIDVVRVTIYPSEADIPKAQFVDPNMTAFTFELTCDDFYVFSDFESTFESENGYKFGIDGRLLVTSSGPNQGVSYTENELLPIPKRAGGTIVFQIGQYSSIEDLAGSCSFLIKKADDDMIPATMAPVLIQDEIGAYQIVHPVEGMEYRYERYGSSGGGTIDLSTVKDPTTTSLLWPGDGVHPSSFMSGGGSYVIKIRGFKDGVTTEVGYVSYVGVN